MAETKKSNRGRRSKYDTEVKPYLDKIRQWAIDGATEKEICSVLDVATSSFYEYKKKYPELMSAVKKGRQELVLDIRGALAKKAKGYEYEEKKTSIRKDDKTGQDVKYTEITVKHQPPSEAAAQILLKNYDKEWFDNPAMYNLKVQEYELKKQMAETNNW